MNAHTLRRAAALLALATAGRAQTQLIHATDDVNDIFGHSMIAVADRDGDGARDLLIQDTETSLFGGPDYQVRLLSGTTLEPIGLPYEVGSSLGVSLADLGDHDGDGQQAWLVGAPGDAPGFLDPLVQAGSVRVLEGDPATGYVATDYLAGTEEYQHFGAAVAALGDVNGDGTGDFAVGAPGEGFTDKGRVTVYSGSTLQPLWSATGTDQSSFGAALAGLGDFNGDGIPDLAIGAPGDDGVGLDGGYVAIRGGSNGSQIWGMLGAEPGSRLGHCVASTPDLSGDGRPDLLVSAPHEQGKRGVVRVIKSAWGGAPVWLATGAIVNETLGWSLESAGDVNHDGHADVLAGAPGFFAEQGRLQLLSGTDGSLLMSLLGNGLGERFGAEVAALGDLDGEGWLEFAVSTPKDVVGSSTSGSITTFGAWVDQPNLGLGGPGDTQLRVRGFPLASGGQADLTLAGADAFAPVYLLASLGQLDLPFKGGTLVPNVGLGALVFAAADAGGELKLAGIPGGLGLIDVYVQAITPGAAQAKGFEISNAVKVQFKN
jgi:hypothetical protein